MTERPNEPTRIFITYSWEETPHNEKVLSLTERLRNDGYDAVSDNFLIQEETSKDLRTMMHQELMKAEKVIVILSAGYKTKAEAMSGGVGIEYKLILKDIEEKPKKYILVTFQKYDRSIVPLGFKDREVISLIDLEGMDALHDKLDDVKPIAFSPVGPKRIKREPRKIIPFALKDQPEVDVSKVSFEDDYKPIPWNIPEAEEALTIALNTNDVEPVKQVIQYNPFLLYDIYDRKMSAMPIFHDVQLGKMICDFTWLDDASGGPIWVLVKFGAPSLEITNAEGQINPEILAEIEQLSSWRRFLEQNAAQKKKIFGAAADFKFQLVIGDADGWKTEAARLWRSKHNRDSLVNIRSYNTLARSLEEIKVAPGAFYRFVHYPKTSPDSKLELFWRNYDWMDRWRLILP